MKEHFKKYGMIYQMIGIIFCLILSITFIYLGLKNKKNNTYTEEEATNLMKLKADKLTRMLEINNTNSSCKTTEAITLAQKEMETYEFDVKLYKTVTYKMKCEEEKQIISFTIIGKGDFEGYQITDYISNQNV